jgi:phage baseplate assembly protein W
MASLVFVNRAPDYVDLDLDFLRHPTTGDVVAKSGNEAIKRSIRNLVFTNFYDRPFRSYIGCNVRKLLFDNIDSFTPQHIEDSIISVINNFEPRVKDIAVRVSADFDRNGFNVELQYVIKNREEPVITSIFLERIR